MILFRCPACGTAHRAEPQYAGGTIPCRRCGTQVPIPRQSEPGCVLVYKAGDAEDGIPMTAEEVRLKLVSGELAETDLLWETNTWKPLSQVFGGVREGEGLRLKRRDESAKEEGELPAALQPIDAVQKVDMSDVEAERMTETKRKRLLSLRRPEAKAEKPPEVSPPAPPGAPAAAPAAGTAPQTAPAEEQAAKPRKPRGRLYYTAQSLLLLFAVVAGYKLGVGPLISQYRDKPTYVVIQNHEETDYTAALGWRRTSEELLARGLVNFEVWVGMPERHTLRLKPKTPGAGESFSLQVPVRPGGVTLVNLKGKGEYAIYDLHEVAGKSLDTPEVKALAAEIGSNRAPDSAIKVNRQIRDLVAPAFKGLRKDLFFRSSSYEIDKSVIYKLRDREAIRRKKQADKAKEAEAEPEAEESVPAKPLVAFPAARVVPFANGSGLQDPANENRVDRTIVLPLTSITLSSGTPPRVITVHSPRLTLTGDDKVLRLQIRLPNLPVTEAGKSFSGQWEYSAECSLEGKGTTPWRWNWVYKGGGESSGRRYSLDIKVEMDGKESRSVKPL